MVVEYENTEVDIEISNIERSKERYGGYTVFEEEIDLNYSLPKDLVEDEFEDFIHKNHITELIEIFEDGQ